MDWLQDKQINAQQYSVLIPYRDLEILLEAAAKMEEMERRLKRMDERCAAMQMMYSEILEKVAEISRLL